MPKRTYQPSKRTRKQQFGFRARMKTEEGRDIIRRRRNAGRKRLVPKGVEVKFRRHTNSNHPEKADKAYADNARRERAERRKFLAARRVYRQAYLAKINSKKK
jgi:large subunit ribosomal protein L34